MLFSPLPLLLNRMPHPSCLSRPTSPIHLQFTFTCLRQPGPLRPKSLLIWQSNRIPMLPPDPGNSPSPTRHRSTIGRIASVPFCVPGQDAQQPTPRPMKEDSLYSIGYSGSPWFSVYRSIEDRSHKVTQLITAVLLVCMSMSTYLHVSTFAWCMHVVEAGHVKYVCTASQTRTGIEYSGLACLF